MAHCDKCQVFLQKTLFLKIPPQFVAIEDIQNATIRHFIYIQTLKTVKFLKICCTSFIEMRSML
jgi:hypothetical protein